MTTSDPRHPATWARRERARQQGDVAASREFTSVVVLACSILLLALFAAPIAGAVRGWAVQSWSQPQVGQPTGIAPSGNADASIAARLSSFAADACWPPVAGLGTALLAIALLVGWMHGGCGFYWNRLRWEAKRLGFSQWAGRMQDPATAALRTTLAALRWGALLAVLGWSLWRRRGDLLLLPSAPADRILPAAGELLFSVLLAALAVLFVFGLVDLAIERRRYEVRLRMSDDELRREMRAAEVDPYLVSRHRAFVGPGVRQSPDRRPRAAD
jgi:flagellar biosynthetic protein FlhB